MGKFHDYLEGFDRSADADLNTVFADLTTAYDEDFSIPAAAVAEANASLEGAAAEIQRLKAHNYELLMAVQSSPADSTADELPDDSSEITTDDLFN